MTEPNNLRRKLAAIAFGCTLLAGCDDLHSPVGPSPQLEPPRPDVLNVAGTWSAEIVNSATETYQGILELDQTGTVIRGTLTLNVGPDIDTRTLSGALSGSELTFTFGAFDCFFSDGEESGSATVSDDSHSMEGSLHLDVCTEDYEAEDWDFSATSRTAPLSGLSGTWEVAISGSHEHDGVLELSQSGTEVSGRLLWHNVADDFFGTSGVKEVTGTVSGSEFSFTTVSPDCTLIENGTGVAIFSSDGRSMDGRLHSEVHCEHNGEAENWDFRAVKR